MDKGKHIVISFIFRKDMPQIMGQFDEYIDALDFVRENKNCIILSRANKGLEFNVRVPYWDIENRWILE